MFLGKDEDSHANIFNRESCELFSEVDQTFMIYL